MSKERRRIDIAKCMYLFTDTLLQRVSKGEVLLHRYSGLTSPQRSATRSSLSLQAGYSLSSARRSNGNSSRVFCRRGSRSISSAVHRSSPWRRIRRPSARTRRFSLARSRTLSAVASARTVRSRLTLSGVQSVSRCALLGTMFVTGSVDGFVEVWDITTGKINTELPYQVRAQLVASQCRSRRCDCVYSPVTRRLPSST